MADAFATMIIPASLTPLARALAAGLSERGFGMFTAELSPSGSRPATHYASSGLIDADIKALLTDPAGLHAACVEAGASVTLAQCEALVAQSDVSEDAPYVALERLGLQLVAE